MYTKYQRGWIHGLAGYEAPGGVPVEVVQFTPPKPVAENWFVTFFSRLFRFLGIRLTPTMGETRLNFSILAAADLIVNLGKLAKDQTILPRLNLVIRTGASEEKDTEYQMGNAKIEAVLPAQDLTGISAVNIRCDSMAIRAGISLNPGPPAGAPEIRSMGTNKGWLFTPGGENHQKGIAVEVENFVPPDYDGRLVVHFGKPSPAIQELVQNHRRAHELIMVLPDRDSQRYVEFKLWDIQAIALESDRKAIFESNFIECLTG